VDVVAEMRFVISRNEDGTYRVAAPNYKGGWVQDGETADAIAEALEASTFMLEALLFQLDAWKIKPAVNARAQIEKNKEFVCFSEDER
jgi:hypothetical protein